MFGTIIQDAYKEDEKEILATAIDDICSPNDNYGWASAGVYCFWDYLTREILYIGLARDFYTRFKQHNNPNLANSKGSKARNINNYFKENEKLGYTIFVQSPIHQPVTAKNIYNLFGKNPETEKISDYNDESVKRDYITAEGILIEAHRKKFQTIPAWNKISGSKNGQITSTSGNYKIVENFSTQKPSPLVSKYSIREIFNNPTFERHENFLHAARSLMLARGYNFKDALEFCKRSDESTYKELLEENYFNKVLKV